MNLFNFEDEEFSERKYVLTSPRSLQACDALGVKPAELLYKPLAEFQADYRHGSTTVRDIYDRYDHHEQERQRKLKSCRELRDNMLHEDLLSKMRASPPTKGRSVSAHEVVDDGYRSGGSIEHPVLTGYRDDASLQRLRTAAVLKQNSEKIGAREKALSPAHSTGGRYFAPTKMYRPSSVQTRPSSALASPLSVTQRRRAQSARPTKRRPASTCLGRSGNDYELSEQFSRSLAVNDLVSWRPPGYQSSYLRDRELRRSLGYENSSSKVTMKDQRILEALHKKNQNEVDDEINRTWARSRWDDERLRYEQDKNLSESHRRRLLIERQALAEEQQMMRRESRYQDGERLRQSLLDKHEQNDMRWRVSSNRQQHIQTMASKERRWRSHERKKSQERALAEFSRERQAYADRLKFDSDLQVKKVTMRRSNHEFNETTKRKRQNQREEKLHQNRYQKVLKRSKQKQKDLKESLDLKDIQTRRNQSAVTHSRDYSLHVNAKKRNHKFSRTKDNRERLEEEMSDWRRNLRTRRSLLESKAKLTAAQSIELKSLRAQAEREARESKHRETYERLQEEAELSRIDQRDAIAYKDTKMKFVESHKQDVVGKVRSLAASSQRMREELRHRYGKDSFDKKALETELQCRIGQGHRSATKNRSTLTLA